jgi:DNA-binding MarR family transcriptional regulator
MAKPLTPNMEMYLKTIYQIVDEGSDPRVKLIADRLGVKMPSVTGALETLRARGLVSHDRYGDVQLTARGKKTAREVKGRNDLIHKFLLEVLKLPARDRGAGCMHIGARGEPDDARAPGLVPGIPARVQPRRQRNHYPLRALARVRRARRQLHRVPRPGRIAMRVMSVDFILTLGPSNILSRHDDHWG